MRQQVKLSPLAGPGTAMPPYASGIRGIQDRISDFSWWSALTPTRLPGTVTQQAFCGPAAPPANARSSWHGRLAHVFSHTIAQNLFGHVLTLRPPRPSFSFSFSFSRPLPSRRLTGALLPPPVAGAEHTAMPAAGCGRRSRGRGAGARPKSPRPPPRGPRASRADSTACRHPGPE